ncbi:hypothetical protein P7K49_030176, partial [Saguinus oedipus]
MRPACRLPSCPGARSFHQLRLSFNNLVKRNDTVSHSHWLVLTEHLMGGSPFLAGLPFISQSRRLGQDFPTRQHATATVPTPPCNMRKVRKRQPRTAGLHALPSGSPGSAGLLRASPGL